MHWSVYETPIPPTLRFTNEKTNKQFPRKVSNKTKNTFTGA